MTQRRFADVAAAVGPEGGDGGDGGGRSAPGTAEKPGSVMSFPGAAAVLADRL